jgi:hypothetical protein
VTARLTARVLVSAIIRKAQVEGGGATVLAKGDEQAGAVLIAWVDRGVHRALLERLLGNDGTYAWQRVGSADSPDAYLVRRRRADPDLWVVELDIPDGERFAAEITGIG